MYYPKRVKLLEAPETSCKGNYKCCYKGTLICMSYGHVTIAECRDTEPPRSIGERVEV